MDCQLPSGPRRQSPSFCYLQHSTMDTQEVKQKDILVQSHFKFSTSFQITFQKHKETLLISVTFMCIYIYIHECSIHVPKTSQGRYVMGFFLSLVICFTSYTPMADPPPAPPPAPPPEPSMLHGAGMWSCCAAGDVTW